MSTEMARGNGPITNGAGYFTPVVDWLADWGALVIDMIATLGETIQFTWQTLYWLVVRRPPREALYPSMYQVGVLSLPVIALTGTFIGMVLAVQSYSQFRSLGMQTRLGPVINTRLLPSSTATRTAWLALHR